MMLPEISVIIPSCNRREKLMKCLASLLSQTDPNFEILVVDDCSTDDTIEHLRKFAEEHPGLKFRWFRNDVNSGANHSRNRGGRESRGEILAFIDSDCIADPGWLSAIRRGFEEGPRIAAVVGEILDPPVRNLYELTYRGNNRLPGRVPNRLVGCNMAVRREPMLRYGWDEDRRFKAWTGFGVPDAGTSGGCDEEGLHLMLKATGWEQRIVHDAVVLHEHHYDRRSFFRQAYVGGGAAAHLVYKYRLWTRIDILPFLLAYGTLPLMLLDVRLGLVSGFFFLGAMAALAYNDLVLKGKSLWDTVRTFPLLVVYYHLRVAGYVIEALRLRLGVRKLQRVSLADMGRDPPLRPPA